MRERLVAVTISTCVLTLSLVACDGPNYGSHRVRTTVTTSPERAHVYAVPMQDWLNAGGVEMLDNPDSLAKYRLGVSPVTDDLKENRSYVFVSDRNGSYTWIERTVSKTKANITIESLE